MSLRVRFWGTRGSIPTPGAQTVRYGGNTPCTEVRTDDGWLIILDAGTGIRELGRELLQRSNGAPIQGDIFLTHAHWDHIQGIPFFAPIFGRGNHFTIWGSQSLERSVDKIVRDQMSPVVFPVTFEELDATIDFRDLVVGTRCEGTGYEVTAFAVQHPGGALGYRFTEPGGRGGALVYVSDNELSPHERYGSAPDWKQQMVEFVRGARIMIHDFRNLLAVIVNYSELIAEETDDPQAVRADIQEIRLAAERAIAMTDKLPRGGHQSPETAK